MPNETDQRIKKIWALVLSNGQFQQLHHTDKHEHLEGALEEGRKAFQDEFIGRLKINTNPFSNLSMSHCLEVPINVTQMEINPEPHQNYEHLAQLLSEHIKSDEGKVLKSQGWVCYQRKKYVKDYALP